LFSPKTVFISIINLLAALQLLAQLPSYTVIPPQYELENIKLNNKTDPGLFYDIAEDREGYCWLSGSRGLHVFDGNQLMTYGGANTAYPLVKDSALLPLYWMHNDRTGKFWLQEENKRYLCFDPQQRKVITAIDEKKPDESLIQVSIDSSNIFYSIVVDNKKKLFYIRKKLPHSPLQVIFQTYYNPRQPAQYRFVKNYHWFIYFDKLIRISTEGDVKEYPLREGVFYYNNANTDNLYILNNQQTGLYKWNSITDSVELFASLPAVIKNNINGIYVLGNRIYLASNRNCYIVNREDHTVQNLSNDFEILIKKETPAGQGITFMNFFMKKDSTLLLCTQNYIYRFKKKFPPVEAFEEPVTHNSGTLSFRGLAQDDKHTVYASFYTGIARKLVSAKKFVPLPVQPYLNGMLISTYSLNYWKNNLLWNNVKIDITSGKHQYIFGDKFSGHTAQYLEHDTLWLFQWNTNELYSYSLQHNTLSTWPIDNALTGVDLLSSINDITGDGTGQNLWIATSDNGLALITKQAKLLKQYTAKSLGIAGNYITSLLLHKEILWFGCSEGLGALNTANGKITIYKNPVVNNGILQYKSIFSIIQDTAANLYLGTNSGISYFNTGTHEFYNLPEGYPLSNIEFNRSSTLKTGDNRFYFGSIDGLYSFVPSQLELVKTSDKLLPVKLCAISVYNNQKNTFRLITENLDDMKQLLLEHDDNNIELNFSVPQYNRKVYYSYRIKGQSGQWTDYKFDNRILIYGLPPGNYTVEVKASTTLSDDNAVYYLLPVIMKQVWYKQWWVITLFILLTLSFLIWMIKSRYDQKLLRQKDLAALRTKISSDLHDDVGTILSGLAMQSQMLTYSAREEQKASLLEISNMSRDAMERMRDTVWAMDNRKDKYENLIDRMRDFAEKNLSLKKMTHEFVIEDIDTKKFINPEKRQAIYLIFKEAITNIVKHSNGNHVRIQLAASKNNLHLVVQDNGAGTENKKSDGLGINNMKMRAEKIGAVLTTRYDNGFVVELMM